MRRNNNDISLYCNVAVVYLEDLQIMHRYGKYWDIRKIGEAVSYQQSGIPNNDDIADSLASLFHRQKHDGAFLRAGRIARPETQCPDTAENGMSIGVDQLAGV